ncbi:hypothetical protein DFH06DRAFT_1052815 [Mycena polygramma]|nr:hypothetical protein DFH06DRAFT_1052815 [Mycena polygramma]
MSSVERLRARIAELSTEIGRQKEVLRNLETDKSLLQRRLNAAVDPVARLPLELSSEIFIQSLPPSSSPGEHPSLQHAPLVLLSVCTTWKDIALSVPALWAAIRIDFPCTEGFTDVLTAWLQRAHNHPLSISLRGPGAFDRAATDIIWRHSRQLKHLEVCHHPIDVDDEEEAPNGGAVVDFLGGCPGALLGLQTLAFRARSGDYSDGYAGTPIVNFLRLTPNLVECTFDLGPIHDLESPTKFLVLHSLRRLSFGEFGDDDLLNWLSLPGLTAISVSLWGACVNDLLLFLKRSSPPLRELVVKADNRPLTTTHLDECLRLVPTVVRFEIRRPIPEFLEEFFDMLAEAPYLLPSLQSLIICPSSLRGVHRGPFPRLWPALSRALSSRRAHIRHVYIELPGRPGPEIAWPWGNTLSALRELKAEGMQLYIGYAGGFSNCI